ERKGISSLLPPVFQRFFEIDNHHHTRLNGGAEEGNVANPDGNAEVVAEQILEEHPAGESKRYCQYDMRCLHNRSEDNAQQHEDDKQDDRHNKHQCAWALSWLSYWSLHFKVTPGGRVID